MPAQSNERCQMKESHLAAKHYYAFDGSWHPQQKSMQELQEKRSTCVMLRVAHTCQVETDWCTHFSRPDRLSAIQETRCAAKSMAALLNLGGLHEDCCCCCKHNMPLAEGLMCLTCVSRPSGSCWMKVRALESAAALSTCSSVASGQP